MLTDEQLQELEEDRKELDRKKRLQRWDNYFVAAIRGGHGSSDGATIADQAVEQYEKRVKKSLE